MRKSISIIVSILISVMMLIISPSVLAKANNTVKIATKKQVSTKAVVNKTNSKKQTVRKATAKKTNTKKQTIVKQPVVKKTTVKADVTKSNVDICNENIGDDNGPTGKYQYPTEKGYNKTMDLTGVKAGETKNSLIVCISTAALSDSWNPINGFDHVAFTVFLDNPSRKGATVLPQQYANTPKGFDWDYEALLVGWNKGLYTSEGATENDFGKDTSVVPDTKVDKDKKTVTMIIPKRALGNSADLKGWKVYVTTWDYDGMTKSFRQIMKVAEDFKFGGGDVDDAKTPHIMDDITPITVNPASEDLIKGSSIEKKFTAEDIDFKIIDSHTHIGVNQDFNMPEDMLLNYMKNYKIQMAVVSNIEAAEIGKNQERIPDALQESQIKANTKTLNLAKANPDKIKCLFWIKPSEGFTKEAEDFMLQNSQYFKGFKFHPFHSGVKVTDEKVKPYLEFADKYGLVVEVHTDMSELADPKYVYEAAQKYKNAKFIMVHLGMGSDGKEAATYASKLPNLYGDTSQETTETVLNAIKICGSEKILYGTDSPIDDGSDTYQYFLDRIQTLKQKLSKEDFENIMYKNAEKLFK